MLESDRKLKASSKIMDNARHIVNQSISSIDESRKSVNYRSTGSIKSAPKFEEAQESEESITGEKVDVSKVV